MVLRLPRKINTIDKSKNKYKIKTEPKQKWGNQGKENTGWKQLR